MRPVIVGVSNPHSQDPRDALSPHFPGSSGSRLFMMARDVSSADNRLTEVEYLDSLERINLSSDHKVWDRELVEEKAQELLSSRVELVFLGAMVQSAFKFKVVKPYFEWWTDMERKFCTLPHPSGLNRLYNDPENRRLTGQIILDLIRRSSR